MAQNYGNSFGIKENGTVKVSTINVWNHIRSRIPVGLVLAKSETWPEGKVIPAGTPASGDEIGGAATVGSSADMSKRFSGLVESDRVMGPDCVTLDVIDEGDLLIDRVSATITDAQKTALKGRIKFTPQIKD